MNTPGRYTRTICRRCRGSHWTSEAVCPHCGLDEEGRLALEQFGRERREILDELADLRGWQRPFARDDQAPP